LDATRSAYAPSGVAKTEAERLRAALQSASHGVAALMARAEGDGAAILEFQVAMLDDDSLSEGAFAAIDAGTDAAAAWTAALDEQIAGYDAVDDAYFRARGSDLRDIRDRVLRALSGVAESHVPPGAVVHARDLTPTEFLS